MKISINWLKQFTDITLSTEDLVKKIGAQLGEVESVTDLGAKYQNVFAVRVASVEKHQNADKLNVCRIDDGGVTTAERGDDGLIQVVCGAPNVRAGLSVAWIPPGAIVPSSYDTDPFVLEARDLRGVVSNGMLASSSELGLTEDHAGILEIDVDAAPGTPFAEVYELNDHIIDIENKMFTHRPDCFGILGVAREVAGITGNKFVSPEWYKTGLDRVKPGGSQLPLNVRNDAPELVPRFMAIAMNDVIIKPSPITLQTMLSRVGLRPINNIVDMTNYLMYLTGQPLHAYDYDKVAAVSGAVPTLVARIAADNEGIELLNGKTVHVDAPTIVIATDQQPIGIGGVMGGATTEVDETTKNIIIECATFNMYNIRKTSMKYGLFTDAVTRFNKGQSPWQNEKILEEAVSMVQFLSDANVASVICDAAGVLPERQPVFVDSDFINARLGLALSVDDIKQTLENVEFEVIKAETALEIIPPFWRTDISIPEDIVEEVGRLIGFDRLPLTLPARSLQPAHKNADLELKKTIRTILSGAGANEVLSYSFVHGKILQQAGQDAEQAFKLTNALSPDLQYYRLSVLPSLLDKISLNIKAGHQSFALFELGKSHQKGAQDQHEPTVPHEEIVLSLVVADAKADQAAYYSVRQYLTYLCDQLGIIEGAVQFAPLRTESQLSRSFEPARAAEIILNGETVGVIGEFKTSVRKDFKLPVATAGFEIKLAALRHQVLNGYVPLPKYPKVEQDISLKVPSAVSYGQLYGCVSDELGLSRPENTYHTLKPVDIYQRQDEAEHKQITLRLTIASYDRTLTAPEVNTLLDSVGSKAHDTLGAERL